MFSCPYQNPNYHELNFEFLHEHIGMICVSTIGLVQVSSGFREIPTDRFQWHPRYCLIGWFVLPLMIAQLLDTTSSWG